ncbi:MAG TPA: DNA primase, partial [Terracidiphilus sp.]
FFHCFGCGVSGDVFTFVGKIENVSFPEAVRIVAQKCGIPLPKKEYSSPEEAAEARMRAKLMELHEAATLWFEQQLAGPEGAIAREYLTGRGLDAEGIKKFRIGYAPDSFNALRDHLSKIADAETLRASGLFSQKEHEDGTLGPIYDRFRKRVTFPIANEGGRVIAFTARTLETGEKADAKYINSPETPLYTKGQVLFNLDKAKSAIRQAGFALLVEGQMDCISVYLRGIQNVIATSGTAFTEMQVAILKRHIALPPQKPQIVLNFDPDTAGSSAASKTEQMLAREGFIIKIAALDDGLDPDRFIRERGINAYIQAVRGAKRRSIFYIDRARQLFPGQNTEQKLNQLNYLLPHINDSKEMLEKEEFAADAAQKLSIDSAVLREELRQAALKRQDRIEVRSSALSEVERVLLRALAIVDPDHERARHLAAQALADQPTWFEGLPTFPALQALAGRNASDPMEVVEDEVQRARLAEALFGETIPPSEELVAETLAWHEAGLIETQLRNVRAQMAEVEKNAGWEEALKLNQTRAALEMRLSELKKSGQRDSGQ